MISWPHIRKCGLIGFQESRTGLCIAANVALLGCSETPVLSALPRPSQPDVQPGIRVRCETPKVLGNVTAYPRA